MHQAFSLVPGTKISKYEQGVKNGLDQVPESIKRKQKAKIKLTTREKLFVDNLRWSKQDALKPPSKRSSWLFKFKEDHEESSYDESSDNNDETSKYVGGDSSDSILSQSDSLFDEKVDDDDNDCDLGINSSFVNEKDVKKSNDSSVTNIDPIPIIQSESREEGKKQSRRNKPQSNNDSDGKVPSTVESQVGATESINAATANDKNYSDDMMDIRLLINPLIQDSKNTNVREGNTKVYNMQVLQNGAILSDHELHVSDPEGQVTKQLKYHNFTLNLALKL